jgi:hypothetical protein
VRGAGDRLHVIGQPCRVAFGDQGECLGVGGRDGVGDARLDHRSSMLGGADLAVFDRVSQRPGQFLMHRYGVAGTSTPAVREAARQGPRAARQV